MPRTRHFVREAALGVIVALALAGCHGQTAGIPADAEEIGTQRGGLAFIASDKGVLYVFDNQLGRTIYTTPLNYAQKVFLYPQGNQILLDGVPVQKSADLNSDHLYRLFFLKG